MRCYISSSSSPKKDISDIVNDINRFGFSRIELTGNVGYSEGLEDKILELKERRGLDVMIHNYLPFRNEDFVLNLASRDPDVKRKTSRHIAEAVKLSKRLDNDLYGMHAGFRHDLLPEMKDDFFMVKTRDCNKKEDFYGFLAEVFRSPEVGDFRIAVENLFPKSLNNIYAFLCTPEEIEDLLDYFKGTPNLGLLLDLGHLNIAAAKLGFDRRKALDTLFGKHIDRIFEIHISENDGFNDMHGKCGLDSWQLECVADHKRSLKDVPVVFEWRDSVSKASFRHFELIEKKLKD